MTFAIRIRIILTQKKRAKEEGNGEIVAQVAKITKITVIIFQLEGRALV